MAQKDEKEYDCHYVDNGSYRVMKVTLDDKSVKEWATEFPNDRLEAVKD